jgi:hypothetical protein
MAAVTGSAPENPQRRANRNQSDSGPGRIGREELRAEIEELPADLERVLASSKAATEAAEFYATTLEAIDDLISEAQRVQRLIARAGTDEGLSARSLASSVGASANTVGTWVMRSQIEYRGF